MTSETKKCSVCKQVKSVTEFPKDSSRPDGVSYTCRQCYREYRKRHKAPARRPATDEDRQRQREYNKQHWASMTVEQRREHNAKMRVYKAANREKVRQSHRDYRQANPNKIAVYAASYKERKPEAVAAKNAVNNAIKEGRLLPVKTQLCADCGKQAQNYHHESYAPEHQLDVVPLCRSCHKQRHLKPPTGL